MHIALLQGGISAEREVSLTSGACVLEALQTLGHEVSVIDAQPDVAEKLAALKPDVAFNALHGRFGEDGCVQGMLEWLNIPYTHSGVLASALAMHKPTAKRLFSLAGLQCPSGGLFSWQQILAGDVMERPYVIKPMDEGSSVGVQIIRPGDALPVIEPERLEEVVLVEPFIKGREIQVAVLNDIALGAIEISVSDGFYDYEAKYTEGRARHLMPAPILAMQYNEVLEQAVRAHQALGCRGLTRSDFILDETQGQLYLLEINTQPGMTPLSLAPEIALHAGIDYVMLVDQLLKEARLDA